MNESTIKALLIYKSKFDVETSLQRAISFLQEKNVRIFSHISHSKAASEVGLSMPKEELLIFGNPKVGTDLMLENPSIGIELPLKIIIWQEGTTTYVGCQNMRYLAEEYSLQKTQTVIEAIEKFLSQLINEIIA